MITISYIPVYVRISYTEVSVCGYNILQLVKLCGIHISVVVGILRMHVDYWHFEAVIEVSIVSTKLDSDLPVDVCDGTA